jgi:hypothetical protein
VGVQVRLLAINLALEVVGVLVGLEQEASHL